MARGNARYAIAIALAFSVTVASPARAQRTAAKASATVQAPTGADVDLAEHLYAKLDYDQANTVAERVLKKGAGLSHDQLLRAARVLAVTYAILDKEDQARDAFLQVLVYDPDYQADPNLGPKVNTPFMEARGGFHSLSSKPGIEIAAQVDSSGGSLRVSSRDPTRMVKRINVGYRWTASSEYTVTSPSTAEATSVVEVTAAPAGRSRLDFYAQALDERDNVVLEAGNPSVPRNAFALTPRVPPPGAAKSENSEKRSIFASPVFWLVASAAVVGAGTAAFFAFRPQDPPTKATLSPVILCGEGRCN